MRLGLLARNPAEQANPPSPQRPDLHVWTAEELRRFLASTREDRLAALWLLLATTGLRRGEALALRWSDVDLAAERLAIRRTLSSLGGRVEFGRPKTARSRRPIVLDPVTAGALEEHRRRQEQEQHDWGNGYQDSDLVFAREDGTPLRPDSVSRRFQQLAGDAGLPTIRVHDLRHTYATIALGAGTHPKIVAERLGHSTIAVTLDIYSHVIPSIEEQGARQIAAAIFGEGQPEDDVR